MIGGSTGVEHVQRLLFTFVLHRIEQQCILFFVDRQYRFPTHRRPATERHCDFILRDQLLGLLRKQIPVTGRIDHDRLHLLAEYATGRINLFHRHQYDIPQRRL